MITNHQNVWIHPHGKPEQAVEARVELISENQRSIALMLADKPVWVKIVESGVMLFGDGRGIAMLLMRESVGPWIELVGGGHYEIEEERPHA